ncbi:MAG: hypothetical protein LUG46_08280 [Erysipelotrichaceae bacterium]|nr:hypothetical protein [Erysipelotrichaceae bacterium]
MDNSKIITKNKDYDDVHMIYPTGYELALKAREVIKEYTSIMISDDQVNYMLYI